MISNTVKSKIINILLLLVFAYFTFLMIQITLRYIPFSSVASFLQIKQTEVQQYPYYVYVFYVHVYTAVFSLLAGFTQFSSVIRRQYFQVHRSVGYLYIITVLFFAAPAGLIMGLHANGGVVAVLFFTALSVLWWWFTYRGFTFARKADIANHRKFMIRSFSLTLSAITLRMWKVVLVYLFQPAPMDVYIIVAGLGWVPNLVIAEMIIKKLYHE